MTTNSNTNRVDDLEDPLAIYLNPSKDNDLEKIADAFLNDDPSPMNEINNFNENLNNENNKEEITIYMLREKLQKISSSLQALNMNKKIIQIFNYSECVNIINSFDKKNYNFILNLFNLISYLICKYKDESSLKQDSYSKLNILEKNISEYEKKITKLQKEIIYKEKEINNIINKNNMEIEKIQYNKKNVNNEITDLKTENKKLNSLLSLYKNEIRKKDNEYMKVTEKYREIINKNSKGNYNTVNISTNLKKNNDYLNIESLKEDIDKKTIFELESINKENKSLIKFIKIVINYMEKIYELISQVNFYKEDTQYIKLTVDLINSNNLANDEFIKDFNNSLSNNLEYIFKFINFLIEQYQNRQQDNIIEYINYNQNINKNSNSKWFEQRINK